MGVYEHILGKKHFKYIFRLYKQVIYYLNKSIGED